MLRIAKLATIVGVGLLACGAANATPVPAGTASADLQTNPTVDNTLGTITLGNSASFTSGSDQFADANGASATLSTSTFSFSEVAGQLVDYSANPVTSFLTFTLDGDTYSFSLDQSIQTLSYSYDSDSNTGQIGLYILGDLTATGPTPFTDPTATALTLTLNETGGGGYTGSITLANPAPGSGVSAPEPASMLLMGSGLAALGLVRRRAKR